MPNDLMDASLIDSIPADELDGASSNGRTLSQSPAAKRARDLRQRRKDGNAPPVGQGKPGRPRGSKRAGGVSRTPRTPRTLYPEIAANLTMINMLVTMTPIGSRFEPSGSVTMLPVGENMSIPIPDMTMTKLGDELDELEIAHLAKALDAQCQRSTRFRKYVETFLGVAAGGGIFAILGIIGGRRAARHKLIDPSLDEKLGRMLVGDISSIAEFVPSPTAPDETPNPLTGEVAPVPDTDGADFESM